MSLVTPEERKAYVEASSCPDHSCDMCQEYINTGNEVVRPVTREQYMASLSRDYPCGIPDCLIPSWYR